MTERGKKYRVNYGNGQVSASFKTLREAERELELGRQHGDPGTTFIQKYIHEWGEESGDWFSVRRSAA